MNDLDEWHLCDGIEEVQTHQPLRPCEPRGQGLQPEARCVGREQRRVLHARLEPAVELLFRLEILEDRLDDDVGRRDAIAIHVRPQPPARFGDPGRHFQPFFE